MCIVLNKLLSLGVIEKGVMCNITRETLFI